MIDPQPLLLLMVLAAMLGVLAGAVVNRLIDVVATGCALARPRAELANGALWGVAVLWCGLTGALGLLPLMLALSSAGLALFVVDAKVHRLPNPIVLALYPITVIGLLIAGLASGEWPVVRALLGAVVWLGVFGLVWLVSRGRGMGFGDVKLAPVLGAVLAWLGWGPNLVGLFAAWIIGGVVALVLLVSGRARRGSHLAFGPYMLIGAAVGLLVGAPVLDWYLGV